MHRERPILITIIALVQIIPIVLLPPSLYQSLTPLLLAVPLVMFAVLAWALLTLRPVGRTLTVFVQGSNIIVRILITLARAVPSKKPGTPADLPLVVTSLLAIAISTVILYYVDRTDTQLLFES